MFITSIFDTSHALFDASRALFQSTAQKDFPTPYAILFPGGNTPRALFQHIVESPFPVAPSLHIGYTDERLVPVKDPANNYALSLPILQALDVKPDQILRVNTDFSLEAAADDYNSAWHEFFEQQGTIPLAFAGVGADGHTCSLFTEKQLLACTATRFAEPVIRDEGPNRVTITPALLEKIKHVIVLATGPEKAEVIEQLSKNPDALVAGKALAACSRVSIWYAAD